MTEDKKETKKSAKERDDGNYEKELISKFPDLQLAQLRYLCSHKELNKDVKDAKKKELYEAIVANDMAPYYTLFCADLGIAPDQAVQGKMLAANAQRVKEIDAEIEDAEKNLGESEVRQALLKKFEYYCQIGDKEAAQKAYTATYDKTVGMGYRIDLVFSMVRVGLFFLDHALIKRFIDKAKELMEQGGDWERKNRLRSYEALYKMAVRDFVGAAQLYLEAVPTFGSYELMSYENLVFYAVITAIYAFDRPDLREKVIRSNEIQEQLTGGGLNGCLIPLREYLDAYYHCYYDRFFMQLAALESERLKFDRYLAPHYNFYSRAMRRKAYQQYLAPYKTVRTMAMAKEFGVSREYIDHELFKFISSGQLFCRIDAVNGVIEMAHPDSKNTVYKQVIKDGDALLNRIQKLSRVINA